MIMLKIYLGFLIVGILGLLSSLLFDADGDASDISDGIDAGDSVDGSPKVFSLRVIFAFLLSFAIGGGAMYYSDHSIGWQMIVGMAAGVATSLFTWWIFKVLYSMQGSSNVDSSDFIGKSGEIVVGTTTNTGKSKVRVSTHLGPHELLCKEANDVTLDVGDLVKVSGKIGTLLIVTKQ